jgi:hypothetical protein
MHAGIVLPPSNNPEMGILQGDIRYSYSVGKDSSKLKNQRLNKNDLVSSQGAGQREREVLETSLKREHYGWQIGVYKEIQNALQ